MNYFFKKFKFLLTFFTDITGVIIYSNGLWRHVIQQFLHNLQKKINFFSVKSFSLDHAFN